MSPFLCLVASPQGHFCHHRHKPSSSSLRRLVAAAWHGGGRSFARSSPTLLLPYPLAPRKAFLSAAVLENPSLPPTVPEVVHLVGLMQQDHRQAVELSKLFGLVLQINPESPDVADCVGRLAFVCRYNMGIFVLTGSGCEQAITHLVSVLPALIQEKHSDALLIDIVSILTSFISRENGAIMVSSLPAFSLVIDALLAVASSRCGVVGESACEVTGCIAVCFGMMMSFKLMFDNFFGNICRKLSLLKVLCSCLGSASDAGRLDSAKCMLFGLSSLLAEARGSLFISKRSETVANISQSFQSAVKQFPDQLPSQTVISLTRSLATFHFSRLELLNSGLLESVLPYILRNMELPIPSAISAAHAICAHDTALCLAYISRDFNGRYLLSTCAQMSMICSWLVVLIVHLIQENSRLHFNIVGDACWALANLCSQFPVLTFVSSSNSLPALIQGLFKLLGPGQDNIEAPQVAVSVAGDIAFLFSQLVGSNEVRNILFQLEAVVSGHSGSIAAFLPSFLRRPSVAVDFMCLALRLLQTCEGDHEAALIKDFSFWAESENALPVILSYMSHPSHLYRAPAAALITGIMENSKMKSALGRKAPTSDIAVLAQRVTALASSPVSAVFNNPSLAGEFWDREFREKAAGSESPAKVPASPPETRQMLLIPSADSAFYRVPVDCCALVLRNVTLSDLAGDPMVLALLAAPYPTAPIKVFEGKRSVTVAWNWKSEFPAAKILVNSIQFFIEARLITGPASMSSSVERVLAASACKGTGDYEWSCVLEGLVPGCEYNISVTTRLILHRDSPLTFVGAYSLVKTTSAEPPCPSNLSLASRNRTTLKIAWDCGNPVTGFEIRSRKSGGGLVGEDWILQESSESNCKISKLAAGVEYEVSCRACNVHGKSEWTDAVVFITAPSVPSAPEIRFESKPGTYIIEWDEPANNGSEISQYLLEEDNTASKGKGFHTVYGGIEKQYVMQNPPETGKPVRYRVRADNAEGCGVFSKIIEFLPQSAVPPAPSGLSAVTTATSITLIWKSSRIPKGPPVNNYVIRQRSSSLSSDWEDIRSVDSNTFQVVIEKLPVNTPLEFRVFASNSSGMSEGAMLATRTTCDVPGRPVAPVVTELLATSVSLTVTNPSYSGGSDISRLEVYMCTPASKDVPDTECVWSKIATGLVPHIQASGLQAGQLHKIQVCAGNSVGLGNPSPSIFIRARHKTPIAPINVSVSDVGLESAMIHFSLPQFLQSPLLDGDMTKDVYPAVGAFKVELTSSDPSAKDKVTKTVLPAPLSSSKSGFQLSKLAPSTSYKIRVQSRSAEGTAATALTSAWTQPIEFVTQTGTLSTPTNVTIKPDPKSGIVTLNWLSSADRFLVEVDTGVGFKKVWEGPSKTCALQVDDPCAFNVRVYSVSNTTPPRQSDYFELRSFVPGKLPGIEAFKNAGFTDRGEITLSWYSSDKAKNYLFDAALDGKDKDNERVSLQVSYGAPSNGKLWCQALLDVPAGKHQINIRSRCENGSQFFFGEQSATITIVVPSKPPSAAESPNKVTPAVQGTSSLSAAAASIGVSPTSQFSVPSSFGLPFHSAFSQPVSLPLASAEALDSASVLSMKPAFAAAAAASFPSASALPQNTSAASSWSSFGSGQSGGLWGDHSSLKTFQNQSMWTGQLDDRVDPIHPDDATAQAQLPSFFAADSVEDCYLEGDDDIVGTLGSATAESLFGFDELSSAGNSSWSQPAAAAAPATSFTLSSASSWESSTAPAAPQKPVPISSSSAAFETPSVQPPHSPISPSKAPPQQQQQGGAASNTPVVALLALATCDTTWSLSDFNDGMRSIFLRLSGTEAATCAISLRDELMQNPRSSCNDNDRPRLLRTLLLNTLKVHAPDIYYMRYADHDDGSA